MKASGDLIPGSPVHLPKGAVNLCVRDPFPGRTHYICIVFREETSRDGFVRVIELFQHSMMCVLSLYQAGEKHLTKLGCYERTSPLEGRVLVVN